MSSQVSRICAEIDDKIKAFLHRPIGGDRPYLRIDATYVKLHQNVRIVSVAVTITVASTAMAGAKFSAWTSALRSGDVPDGVPAQARPRRRTILRVVVDATAEPTPTPHGHSQLG
jgi:hypothetical protein